MEFELLSSMPPESVANLQLPDPYLLSYYKGLESRTLWLDREVNEDTLDLCRQIVQWNIEDKEIAPDEREPIKLFIDSPGGNLIECFALVDTIMSSVTPVYTICAGMAASAAFPIYLSGAKRYVMPHAQFMWHQGGAEIQGTAQEVQSASKNYGRTLQRMAEFIISRVPKIDKRMLNRKCKGSDWYIHGDEAMELGVAHHIFSIGTVYDW